MSATALRDVGELDKALSVDQHGIEPIPDRDRDSTAWQQFWIWFGANISPLQWVAGAIVPQLVLSLVQSIVIMVVGQAAGALIWLGVLGAAMASSSTNSDPAELVASLFGVMTIPVLLVIIHGAVAGNIQCVYSAPLCFLAGGIKLKRWVGSIVSGVIASAVLVGFLASGEFVASYTSYITSFVIWTAAWGVIVLIDFFVLNRGRADVPALYASPETSRYGDIRWRSLVALLVGLVAGWAFEYGSASLFQGPIASATGGADLSWLASIVVGGSAYWLLSLSDPAIARPVRH